MKHIISFSGGAGSFATAKRAKEKYGKESLVAVFCDTLIEDGDLYRFLLDTAKYIFEMDVSEELSNLCNNVPELWEDEQMRYTHLYALCSVWNKEFGNKFVYLQDGRDVWQIFEKHRWVGNSRTAHCTVDLKGGLFRQWIEKAYKPEECVIHFGFDWSEAHRLETAKKNWTPYACEAVLCEPPYYQRNQIMQMIDDAEIDIPRLYELGFSHNNCGGFCVRAGLKHFKNLKEKMPELYNHHAEKYQALADKLPTARPFLKKQVDGKKGYITMVEYSEMLDGKSNDLQEALINDRSSACQCFVA